MARGSKISRIVKFFREGDRDEVRAVVLLLQEAGLLTMTPATAARKRSGGRRPRLNGTPVNSEVNSHSNANKMEAGA